MALGVVSGSGMASLPSAAQQPRQRKLFLAILIGSAGFLNALLTFPVPLLHLTQQDILTELVSVGNVSWAQSDVGDFSVLNHEVPELLSISYCIAVKFLTTVMVLGLPLPVGSIAPTFVIGALIGRLFGFLLHPLCAVEFISCASSVNREVFIAKFALVGACAFCAACFRSFAQVIVVFELTGLVSLLLPLCSASLVAIFTANLLGLNFFDSAIQLKNLPHLPSLAQGRGGQRVSNVMTNEVPILPPQVSADELEAVRDAFGDWKYEVPIVLQKQWDSSRAKLQQLQVDQFALLSAVPCLPPKQPRDTVLDLWEQNVVVPLQVPDYTLLEDLLPMFRHMDKNVAFVTKHGRLVGAVTLSDLHQKAVSRPSPAPALETGLSDRVLQLAGRFQGRQRLT